MQKPPRSSGANQLANWKRRLSAGPRPTLGRASNVFRHGALSELLSLAKVKSSSPWPQRDVSATCVMLLTGRYGSSGGFGVQREQAPCEANNHEPPQQEAKQPRSSCTCGIRKRWHGFNKRLRLCSCAPQARLRHRLQHLWGAHISLINEFRTSKCCCQCGAILSCIFKRRNKHVILKKAQKITPERRDVWENRGAVKSST